MSVIEFVAVSFEAVIVLDAVQGALQPGLQGPMPGDGLALVFCPHNFAEGGAGGAVGVVSGQG